MNRKRIHVSIMLILAIFLSSCAKNHQNSISEYNDTDVKTSQFERERKGRSEDELVVSMGPKIPHEFDPKLRYGQHNEAHITHSTLLRRTADLNIVGDFAKDYKISDDGLLRTLNLNDDFKFSNGEPVRPEDVKFTYEMLKEDGKMWDFSFLEKIEIPSKDQIVFYLKTPRSTFTSALCEVPIVPENHYDDNYKFNPIGSGPYKVVEYRPDEQAIFEINPYYHGKEPYFKKWTRVTLDQNTALAALESGDVDMIYAIPEFADEQIEGCKLFEYESNDVRGLSLPYVKKGVITDSPDGNPVGNDVTSDPIIRKAMNIGMDRKKAVDVVFNGHAKPAYSIIDGTPFFNQETLIEDGKLDEAKKLLDDNGWKAGSDGIRVKDGLKAEFDLYYPTEDEVRKDVAIEAIEQAKDLGINIKLIGSNRDEMAQRSHEQALLYAGGRHHMGQFYESFAPETKGVGWTNIYFYDNPKVSEYLKNAMKATTEEEASKYWKLAQWDGENGASVLGDLPNVWLVRLNHTYLGDEKIDVGDQGIHSHGHDRSLIANIAERKWID